jgi:hypothetical protein
VLVGEEEDELELLNVSFCVNDVDDDVWVELEVLVDFAVEVVAVLRGLVELEALAGLVVDDVEGIEEPCLENEL